MIDKKPQQPVEKKLPTIFDDGNGIQTIVLRRSLDLVLVSTKRPGFGLCKFSIRVVEHAKAVVRGGKQLPAREVISAQPLWERFTISSSTVDGAIQQFEALCRRRDCKVREKKSPQIAIAPATASATLTP